MIRDLHIGSGAIRDIEEQLFYLGGKDEAVGTKWLESVGDTLKSLIDSPDLGSPCELIHVRLTGIRVWSVTGFKNHLVYYRVRGELLEVLRILHGARDVDAIDFEIS